MMLHLFDHCLVLRNIIGWKFGTIINIIHDIIVRLWNNEKDNVEVLSINGVYYHAPPINLPEVSWTGRDWNYWGKYESTTIMKYGAKENWRIIEIPRDGPTLSTVSKQEIGGERRGIVTRKWVTESICEKRSNVL